MTLMNAALRATDVRIVTDSSVCDRSGEPVAFGTKIDVLPHIHALMACRGLVDLHEAARFLLHTTWFPAGIEDAATALARELPARFEARRRELARIDGEEHARFRAYIFGLSARLNRMTGFRPDHLDGFEPRRLEPAVYVQPWAEDGDVLELPGFATAKLLAFSDRELAKLGEAQQRLSTKEGAPWELGGPLWLYQLTTGGYTIRQVGVLPGKAELVARIEARHARTA